MRLFCLTVKFYLACPARWLYNLSCTLSIRYGGLAQLGERNAGSVEVRGSSPLFSTNKKLQNQLVLQLFSLLNVTLIITNASKAP